MSARRPAAPPRAGVRAVLGALAAISGCGPDWRMPRLVEPEPSSDDRDPGAAPRAALHLVDGTPVWTGELAIRAAGCQPACRDRDRDGLSDAWEQALLRAVRPTLWFHRDDGMFFDPDAAMALIGRVTPWQETIQVTIVLAYSRDYGRCGGDEHPGDTERIALELRPLDDGRSVRAERWYTAAHEGTSYDASLRGSFPAQAYGPYGAMQWSREALPESLLVARDKHATYPSLAACAGRRVPCVDDVCAFDLPLAPVPWNAGEPEAPLLEGLDELGFGGQCAWFARVFCGDDRDAPPAASCASPVRQKLEHPAFALPDLTPRPPAPAPAPVPAPAPAHAAAAPPPRSCR